MIQTNEQVGGEEHDQPGKTPYDRFVPGAKDPAGRTIETVIGRHRKLVVWITSENVVGWLYDELPERLRPAVVQFQRLNGIAKSRLGKKQRPIVAGLLGPALYAALLSSDAEDPSLHFEEARCIIYSKCTQVSRLAYVLLSLLFGVVVVAAALSSYVYLPTSESLRTALFVGITGGIIGSVISIIQRARTLKIDPFDSAIVLAFHGLSRVVLGAVFGVLLVAASKSNIALGHFADNLWALFGLAAVAGLTERWVPELLARHAGAEDPSSQ